MFARRRTPKPGDGDADDVPPSPRLSRHRRSQSSGASFLAPAYAAPAPAPEWPSSDAPILASERETAIARLLALVPAAAAVRTRGHVQHALNVTQWRSLNLAAEYLEDWSDAISGSLHPVDRGVALLGIENSGNTCYIDSLLFALFARMDAIDGWLAQSFDDAPLPPAPMAAPVPPPKPLAGAPPGSSSGMVPTPAELAEARRRSLLRAVQVQLILVINRLRKGCLVTRAEMRSVEAAIKQLWAFEGTNAGQPGVQEDVAELFMMLASCLRAPSLPLWQVIHHGGKVDAQDDLRVCTERCLQLAIPDPKAKDPVSLEALLKAYFFDNKVDKISRKVPVVRVSDKLANENRRVYGLRRLASLQSSSSASSSSSSSRVIRADSVLSVEDMLVDGWSMLKLLPFQVGESELGEQSNLLSTAAGPIVIPMLLKRYYRKESNNALKRTSRQVLVPIEINFDQYTADNDVDAAPTAAVGPASYSLVLQAVVCHLGDTPTSGHFITYVNASAPPATRDAAVSAAAVAAAAREPVPPLPPRPPSAAAAPEKDPEAFAAAQVAESAAASAPPLRPRPQPLAESEPASLPPPYSPGALPAKLSPAPPSPAAAATSPPVSPTVTAAAEDALPTWLRFDGLPASNKVQTFTSTAAITRQFMDEVARNAYLVFYELRRTTEDAPSATAVSATTTLPRYSPPAPAPGLLAPPSLPSEGGDGGGESRPLHGRRHSAPHLDQADMALALKMQAKEAGKGRRRDQDCTIM
ncbi:hypothetical protein H9P43_003891 [Blastocladiella emersonii ATCC 22665]|nr:hypothetical protein H9P43_003891 [Blastocladiella emersonii ATCC 22665]